MKEDLLKEYPIIHLRLIQKQDGSEVLSYNEDGSANFIPEFMQRFNDKLYVFKTSLEEPLKQLNVGQSVITFEQFNLQPNEEYIVYIKTNNDINYINIMTIVESRFSNKYKLQFKWLR